MSALRIAVEILFEVFRRKKIVAKSLAEGNAQIYAMLVTVSICGANFLIVVSTPAFSVI